LLRPSVIAALTAALSVSRAQAVGLGTSLFAFDGFGTLGVVHSGEDQADFTSTDFKPNGAGFSHDWSADVDSRLGAQITANATSQLSATAQIIVEHTQPGFRPGGTVNVFSTTVDFVF
jgi:hypothetical protein